MEKKSDNLLKNQVESEIEWDARLWNTDIHVNVADGIVTLTGIVPQYAQKIAAQDAAHRIQGVLDVVNELIIKVLPERTDEELAHSVRKALEWNALVPDEQIRTTITDGLVILEGKVKSLLQKEEAFKVVRNLVGVSGVKNSLEIESQDIQTAELRERIEKALERRALREAGSLRIKIEDGEVNLYGKVHSWEEKRAIVGSISHAPGVKRVNDNLRLDPYF